MQNRYARFYHTDPMTSSFERSVGQVSDATGIVALVPLPCVVTVAGAFLVRLELTTLKENAS